MTSNEERFEAWWASLSKLQQEVISVGSARVGFLAACPQWRPIAEAPKDGTVILLAKILSERFVSDDVFDLCRCEPYICWAASGAWSPKYNNWICGCEIQYPTHFMPLPLPPA